MARPTSPTLLPDASCLHLVRLEADEQFILAVVATTSPEALCPLCQCRSESIHSRYVRVVADLPWAGWAVRLEHDANIARVDTLGTALAERTKRFWGSGRNHGENELLICFQTNEVQAGGIG